MKYISAIVSLVSFLGCTNPVLEMEPENIVEVNSRGCEWDKPAYRAQEELPDGRTLEEVMEEIPVCFSLWDLYSEKSRELDCCLPFRCLQLHEDTDEDRESRFEAATTCDELIQVVWDPRGFDMEHEEP